MTKIENNEQSGNGETKKTKRKKIEPMTPEERQKLKEQSSQIIAPYEERITFPTIFIDLMHVKDAEEKYLKRIEVAKDSEFVTSLHGCWMFVNVPDATITDSDLQNLRKDLDQLLRSYGAVLLQVQEPQTL